MGRCPRDETRNLATVEQPLNFLTDQGRCAMGAVARCQEKRVISAKQAVEIPTKISLENAGVGSTPPSPIDFLAVMAHLGDGVVLEPGS